MLLASLAIVAVLAVPSAASRDDGCYSNSAWTSTCQVSNSGTQIDIGATEDRPGSTSPDRGNDDRATDSNPPVQPTYDPTCLTEFCRPLYSVLSIPDVTLADLASFRPAVPSLIGEPLGFGVAGMPANVVAAASEQRIAGVVLGWNVVVRFVPADFRFEYGDGSSARTATGGATWPQLGQAQFTPTATSHVYRSRGTYPVAVTVRYTASVDFGTGFRPVDGYVSATTAGYDVRVVEVRTALVDKTCAEDPHGPGC